MKKFLVSIIALSVATGAMAASTLVSSGENKSAPSATYRAGSLRANKSATENVTATPVAKNKEIGRIGTIGTKKIVVSSNTNTGGTTGGTQTGGSSSNNTGNNNAGAITNAAFRQELDALSMRVDRAYNAAYGAADSVVSTQNVINSMRNDLDEIKTTITNLRGDSSVNITELVSRIETLQGTLNGLQNNLNTLSTNAVALNTFTERVNTLNQKIEAVKSTAEQLNSAGYLTSASISDLTSRVDNAIATIGTMQQTLATKDEITNMATVSDVATAKQEAMNYTDEAKVGANRYTDDKVNDMATKTFVNESIGFAANTGTVKQYVDSKVGTSDNVSAKDYTDAKVGDTGSYASARAYTDAKTSGMATKTYVNGRIGFDEETGRTVGTTSSIPTVKEYVDGKDVIVRNWVSNDVVGDIGNNVKVKEYVDGMFEEAADPNNENGWAHHIEELAGNLELAQASFEAGQSANNDANTNNSGRIDALEVAQQQNASEIANQAARLDERVDNLKGYFNGLNATTNALQGTVDAFPDSYATKSALADKVSNDVFGNYTNAVAANYVRNDALNNRLKETDAYVALANSVEEIPVSIAATYMTKEDALTDKNNLKNLISARLPIAEFQTKFDTAVQGSADIVKTATFQTVTNKLQEDISDANTAIATKADESSLSEYLPTVNFGYQLQQLLNDPDNGENVVNMLASKIAPKISNNGVTSQYEGPAISTIPQSSTK